VPGSHHLSLSRLALEYWNSVTNTRDGGSWRVGPRAKRWLRIEPRSICCPPNSLVLGVPGRVVRATDETLRERTAQAVAAYLDLAARHRRGEFPRLQSATHPPR